MLAHSSGFKSDLIFALCHDAVISRNRLFAGWSEAGGAVGYKRDEEKEWDGLAMGSISSLR